MRQHQNLLHKFIALALVLIVPVLVSCGGAKEKTPVPTAARTATLGPTATPTVPAIEASIPTVEGPITGLGTPFLASTLSDQALASAGYEAKEYFVSGTATSYRAVNDLTVNGMWEVEPAESAAYKTRILVYRPVDIAAFNGTVVMEWFNVSGGLEGAPDWTAMHNELIRRGYAWVGVSAQIGGVEGGGLSLNLYNMPLKKADAKRYESLHHPGDDYCYDIFSQAARAIRNPGDVNPFAGYHVERILAVGESQSAMRLVTYINAIYPRVQLFDGFLVHSRPGTASSLGSETMADLSKSRLDAVLLRTDIKVPILILETETDVIALGYYKARQDDTDYIRLWEIAGTAHADLYTIKGANDTGIDPTVADVAEVSNPVPGVVELPVPINSGPQHFIACAGIYQLDKWVRTDITPPTADRLKVASDPPEFMLDKFGNVKGGIRTPYVDVPIARLSGEGQPFGLDDPSARYIWGTTKLFDKETIATLYPDHVTYVTAIKNATDAAVKAGFLMPEDGELIKAAAAASNIGTATPTIVPTTPAPTIHAGLDINSTIGQLLDNPDAKAVIDKCIPGFSTNPQVSLARGMTLAQVQPLSSGAITPEMVACVADGLLAIKNILTPTPTLTPTPSEPTGLTFYRNTKFPEGYKNPLLHIEIPQDPFLAPNGKSNFHNDAYMSDTYEVSGPLGLNLTVKFVNYGSDVSKMIMHLPVTLTFDTKGRIVMSISTLEYFKTSLVDRNTLEELATYKHPPRPSWWMTDPLSPYRDTSGGTYIVLDNQDRGIFSAWDYTVKIIKYNDDKGEFELVRSYPLEDQLVPVELPYHDRIQMAIPDWQGQHLWFTTRYGRVGTIDQNSGLVRSIELKGEEIQNSFTVGEDGVYIVSDHAIYRFHAGEDGTPIINWRTVYDRGTQLKQAMMSQGSGQTPLLFADLVAVGDNADVRTNVLFLKRSDGSLVCSTPIFAEGASCTDDSFEGFAREGKYGTEYTFTVDNHWGIDRSNMYGPGGISKNEAGGLTRVDLVPDVNGKYSCKVVWTNPVKSGSATPKISLANGLVYVASCQNFPNDEYVWGLTAIDYATGETVFWVPFGTGVEYTNMGAEITLDPDGGKVYVGVMGGLMIIEDTAP